MTASYILPVSSPPIEGGGVVISNGRIVDFGNSFDLKSKYSCKVSEFPRSVIMPGLVNAHTHLYLTHFSLWKLHKGIEDFPSTYTEWVIQLIKIMRSLSLDEKMASLKDGIAKSLESGTTSVGDIVTEYRLIPEYDRFLLKGRLYLECTGISGSSISQSLEKVRSEISGWQLNSMKPGISPHAPHTVSADHYLALKNEGLKYNLPLMTHVAEAPEERPFYHNGEGDIADRLYPFIGWSGMHSLTRGKTPVSCITEFGILDRNTAAVHAVQVTPDDAKRLKNSSCSIVLCPRSNEKLSVGKAPAFLYKKLGITLALGTDSLASNDSLSLWDEMRACADIHKGLFTPEELIRMATLDGARVLAIDDLTGSISKGLCADLLVVEPVATLKTEKTLAEKLLEGYKRLAVYAGGSCVVES